MTIKKQYFCPRDVDLLGSRSSDSHLPKAEREFDVIVASGSKFQVRFHGTSPVVRNQNQHQFQSAPHTSTSTSTSNAAKNSIAHTPLRGGTAPRPPAVLPPRTPEWAARHPTLISRPWPPYSRFPDRHFAGFPRECALSIRTSGTCADG